MLFWTKVGKYTRAEFGTVFATFKARQRPFILTYFKDAPISTASANKADLSSLWEFQEELKQLGHFQTVYKHIDGLKLHFTQQLDKLAANGFVEFEPGAAQAAAEQANLTGSGAIAASVSVHCRRSPCRPQLPQPTSSRRSRRSRSSRC